MVKTVSIKVSIKVWMSTPFLWGESCWKDSYSITCKQ